MKDYKIKMVDRQSRTDLQYIQELLGHKSSKSSINKIISPLDRLEEKGGESKVIEKVKLQGCICEVRRIYIPVRNTFCLDKSKTNEVIKLFVALK